MAVETRFVSKILGDGKEWKDVNLEMPEMTEDGDWSVPVIVRYVNENIIERRVAVDAEHDEILCAEDIAFAELCVQEGEWLICAPYPKYEYSPLAHHGRLLDGTHVTHWAVPAEGQYEAYVNRYAITEGYRDLGLYVDEEHEEQVYHALLLAAATISMNKDLFGREEGESAYNTLYDLINLINGGVAVIDGETIFVKPNSIEPLTQPMDFDDMVDPYEDVEEDVKEAESDV